MMTTKVMSQECERRSCFRQETTDSLFVKVIFNSIPNDQKEPAILFFFFFNFKWWKKNI